jgi:hypothetical protein
MKKAQPEPLVEPDATRRPIPGTPLHDADSHDEVPRLPWPTFDAQLASPDRSTDDDSAIVSNNV